MKRINWKYAFGEIIIVIIGITIAFSLNNWAEESKNKDQRQEYLSNLRNDIESDKDILELNIKSLQEKMELSAQIVGVLGTDSPEKLGAMRNMFRIANLTNFEANDITYQTLINSGDLKLIRDFELRKAIEAHYSNYKTMRKAYERQENIHKEYLGKFIIENADYDAFARGDFGFTNEKLLENIIHSMRGSFGIKLQATQAGIASCDSLLAKLNSAL